MEIPKLTDADKERFRLAGARRPRVEVKPMFGNLGAFVNGNMFAGLFGPAIGVKLAEEERRDLADQGTGPFGRRAPDGRLRHHARLAPSRNWPDARRWAAKGT